MKNSIQSRLLLMIAAALTSQLPAQETLLKLYLRPEAAPSPLATVAPDDIRLGAAVAVPELDLADQGWRFADFTGEVVGYVPDAKIGKDLLPVDGALIQAGPSADAPVLGTYSDGDPLQIVDTGVWWTVRWTGTFPVFFKASAPEPLPPVTVEGPETLSGDRYLAPENSRLSQPATTGGSSIILTERQRTPSEGIGQNYEGIFRQSKARMGLFKPKAPFFLEAADGSRIAWIDTQDVIISGTLKNFFDKPVVIYGEMEALSSRDWILRARNLREK